MATIEKKVNSPQTVTLTEFCNILSLTDRRVPLISGFYHYGETKGMFRNTEEGFRNAFETFKKLPA